MANPKQIENLLLTEHFRFTPIVCVALIVQLAKLSYLNLPLPDSHRRNNQRRQRTCIPRD